MPEIVVEISVIIIGLVALYFQLTGKTFFRRLGVFATIFCALFVWIFPETRPNVKPEDLVGFSRYYGFAIGMGFVAPAILIISLLLDWLFGSNR